MSTTDLLGNARTWLFVPGDRPERFARAEASGAQVVIIDLEDAVAPERKELARAEVVDHLRTGPSDGPGRVVRINSPLSVAGHADLKALAPLVIRKGLVLAIMTPKADSASVQVAVGALGPFVRLIALVESGLGVEQAFSLASCPQVALLAFGALDYAADVGAQPVGAALAYAESRLVNASAAAGLPRPIARPTVELDDVERLTQEAARQRIFGFGAKLCLHPKQVAVIAQAFKPTQREVDWAKRALVPATGGAVRVDGEMIDAPQVLRAKRILKEAGES